ncbi:hypothetical protein [uncultured Algibacter sp.]|uniref:hypothetical protein n=1 Tax=uncultured Algibacter sp. TaxID=298659 RepID=UPI002638FA2E|nr:hypothetical protein [uncultured Algibacter sp.]
MINHYEITPQTNADQDRKMEIKASFLNLKTNAKKKKIKTTIEPTTSVPDNLTTKWEHKF